MRVSRTISVLAAATLMSGALVGCANPLEQLVQQGAERAVEEAIERETGVEVDVDNGGGASVPADFPGELPQPDGRLASVITTEVVWMLVYDIAEISEAQRLAAWFVDNGYTEISAADTGGLRTWIYENELYSVTLGAMETETVALQYTVKVR